jgi:hypothetical protein
VTPKGVTIEVPSMQIAIHLISILFMCAVFQLGGMISERSDEWSVSLASDAGGYQALRKSFLLSGKIIQIAALIWVLMNVVALMAVVPHF